MSDVFPALTRIIPSCRRQSGLYGIKRIMSHFKNFNNVIICIILIVIFFFKLEKVISELVEFPVNTAVKENSDRVVFRCKSDQNYSLKWYMQSNFSNEKRRLFTGYALVQNALSIYHIGEGEPGKYDLILESTPGEAAQTYTCFEPGTLREISADLIIIEPTKGSITVMRSDAIATCYVKFRGNWAPVLEWSRSGQPITTDRVFTSTHADSMVFSTLIIPLVVVGDNYTCTTRFDISGKPQQTSSTKVPDYNDTIALTVDFGNSSTTSTQLMITEAPANCLYGAGSIALAVIVSVIVTVLMTILMRTLCCRHG